MNRMKLFSFTIFLMMVLFLAACSPDGTVDYEAIFAAAQAEVELAPTVNDSFILPTSVDVQGRTVTISWVSSHPDVVSTTGVVSRPAAGTGDVTVTLTATFKIDDQEHPHDFIIIVEEMPENTYSVSFYNGDVLIDTKVVDAGSKVTPITQPTPEEGYVFGGWFTDETYNEMWDFELDLVNSDLSLYVDWDLMTYIITYNNLNGAAHTNPSHFNITTENHTLSVATLDGFEFVGWYTALEGGNEVTTLTFDVASNIILYARFDVETYTITYMHMEDVINPNPTSYQVTSENVVFQAPTREGYTFKGWFSNEAMTMPVSHIETGSTGNKIIYIKWEATTYTIDYELGDGSMVNTTVDSYTIETPTFNLPDAQLEGFAFIGWFDQLEDGNQVSNITMGTMGDLTLYARYSPYINVYYYGQKDYQIEVSKRYMDNEVLLTTEGEVLTRGEGVKGLIGNGFFDGQDDFVNITSLFSLEVDEVIIDIDLYGELAIALTNQGRIFIWGYLNFIEEALYANMPVDITIQFDFLEAEVPTSVASFGTFSFVFTNQGVYRFEHEESDRLNAPIEDEDFKWGFMFGFGEFSQSLSYQLDDQFFLFDAYLTKDFVNVTNALNLPLEPSIQAVFAQDDAIHVLTDDSYHFAQFQDNTGQPLSMQVPLNLVLDPSEVIVDVFSGGMILTSTGRLLMPEFVNPDENEIPEMISYVNITSMINLNENEVITHVFDPMFVMTSDNRFMMLGSEETEEGNEINFYEIDLSELLQENEVLVDVIFNMYMIMFKTNLGLYEVGFGEFGLELHLMEARSSGMTHHEVLVLANLDPYVYLPEDPMYQTFDGWYLDEELTILWTHELTTDQMVLYPHFVDTHYMIYLNILGSHEPYYVPFNEIPNMEDPMMEHFEFLGWYYLDEEQNYVEFMFDEVLQEGTVLDAHMSPVQYQITIMMDLEHIEIIDITATTMFGNVDFQVFPGYEIIGVYTDMDLLMPLDMEALVLSDITLYVVAQSEAIEIYYYQDMVDASFSTIYAGGNQVFGYLTTGEFVVSGSNYDGALGLGFENNDEIGFAIDMNEVLDLMPGETVLEMSQESARKSLLTSESRVFVWGYYSNIDFNFELVNQAKDITNLLNLSEAQTIVTIKTTNTSVFIFLNDGTIKHFDFSSETVSTFETSMIFNKIIFVMGFLDEYYQFNNHFVVVTDQGIYDVDKENEMNPVIVTDLSSHIAGDEIIFSELDFNGYLLYRLYSKEGRRYLFDLNALTITEDVDLELNVSEELVGIYNVNWNMSAFVTSEGRLFTYDTTVTEVTLTGFNPGETIVGFYLQSNFITNEGRLGTLNINTKQISFTALPLEIGELEVVELISFGWEYGFRLSNQTIITLNGDEYHKPFGMNLTMESYNLGEEFMLLTPEPKEGYIFKGWYEFSGETPYDQNPYQRIFLFAGWEIESN